jgi:uncharacterized short protein YbdD (DUF466 family)
VSEATSADAHPVLRAWRTVRWFWGGVTGADAYEKYRAHQEATHPGEPVMCARDFWKDKWEDQERNPRTRCC